MTSVHRRKSQSLAWATDVHLNFLDEAGVLAFARELAATNADAVLLTGDIAEARSLEDALVRLAEVLKRPIYFVLGNHDFYGGSIAEVRRYFTRWDVARTHPRALWLPAAGVIELSETTALVGHDGWADSRYGNFVGSPVVLNDYRMIAELRDLGDGSSTRRRSALAQRLRDLGDEAARYLDRVLHQAAARERVIVATHVPPFREAAWHEGRPSNNDFLPHFACKAVGDVLLAVAGEFPRTSFEVYCGHTHGGGEVQMLPNLRVTTGAAEYGAPKVQRVLEVA